MVFMVGGEQGDFDDETFGGSIETGKRWDWEKLFVEPQGRLERVWADGKSYRASNGLHVNGSDQGSLRERSGMRAGLHFDSGHAAFEPDAGVFVSNEFLDGDTITTNRTNAFPTLSGPAINATAGANARIGDSLFIYSEYFYEAADKSRTP